MALDERRLVVAGYCPPILSYVARDVTYPVHAHKGHELLYVTRGEGTVYLGGHALRVRAGDLVYAAPHVAHGYALDQGAVALMLGAEVANAREFSAYASATGLDQLVVRGVPRSQRLASTLAYMVEHPQHMKEGVHLATQLSAVFDGLTEIVETWGYACPRVAPTRLDELAEAANAPSIASPDATLRSIARDVGLSPTYLSRSFRGLFGVSYPSYRAIALVNGARRLLAQTDIAVAEIAGLCHYASLRSFNRQFRDVAGMAPTRYRELYAPSEVIDLAAGRDAEPLRAFFRDLLERCPRHPCVTIAPTATSQRLRA